MTQASRFPSRQEKLLVTSPQARQQRFEQGSSNLEVLV